MKVNVKFCLYLSKQRVAVIQLTELMKGVEATKEEKSLSE